MDKKEIVLLYFACMACVNVLAQKEAEKETETAVCEMKPVMGQCRGFMPRFYYDTTDKSCKGFIFGGCGGNKNNFETVDACIDYCVKSVTPPSAIYQLEMPETEKKTTTQAYYLSLLQPKTEKETSKLKIENDANEN